MQFTQIPPQYAPLGGELRYGFELSEPGDADIRILDANGTLLGAKRFAGVTAAAFDAAPCLRRSLHFLPATGGTGLRPAQGRTVTAVIEAAGTDGSTAAAPVRTFLPGTKGIPAAGLLTSMPLSRTITEGACDELTLFTEGSCTVTVTARAGDTLTAQSYRSDAPGLHLFRLDTRDFEGAETLTVDAGGCAQVGYTVVRAPHGAQRLAWRSSAGSVEHYTFPVERATTLTTHRQRAEGPEGRSVARAQTDRLTVLVSACEPRAVLEALAELTAAPEVWTAEGDTYIAVDVLTEEAAVHRHGAPSCLEIAIRAKIRTSWN